MTENETNSLPRLTPTHAVVRNVAQAVQQLGKAIVELEDGLIAVNAHKQRPSSSQVNPLQELDLLFQMAEEISLLLSRLADQIPTDDEIAACDIVSRVRLERLRTMFETTQSPHQPRSQEHQTPRIMLF